MTAAAAADDVKSCCFLVNKPIHTQSEHQLCPLENNDKNNNEHNNNNHNNITTDPNNRRVINILSTS